MTKDLIYQDEVGNKLFRDIDKRLIVLNKEGKLVRKEDVRIFISRPSVKLAMKRYFGDSPKLRVLSSEQTRKLNRRRINTKEPDYGFAKLVR